MKKSTHNRKRSEHAGVFEDLRAVLPKVSLYWCDDDGYQRREVRLISWGFAHHAQNPRSLRVIALPKESRAVGGRLSVEQWTFTRDFPIILTGWEYPVPPDCGTQEEFDQLLSSYLTPGVIFADFSDRTKPALIPDRLAEAIPPLGTTDEDPVAYALLYLKPWQSPWKWLVTAYDPDSQRCRGLVISPIAQEVGDFSLQELESQGILIAAYWKPIRISQCARLFDDAR